MCTMVLCLTVLMMGTVAVAVGETSQEKAADYRAIFFVISAECHAGMLPAEVRPMWDEVATRVIREEVPPAEAEAVAEFVLDQERMRQMDQAMMCVQHSLQEGRVYMEAIVGGPPVALPEDLDRVRTIVHLKKVISSSHLLDLFASMLTTLRPPEVSDAEVEELMASMTRPAAVQALAACIEANASSEDVKACLGAFSDEAGMRYARAQTRIGKEFLVALPRAQRMEVVGALRKFFP